MAESAVAKPQPVMLGGIPELDRTDPDMAARLPGELDRVRSDGYAISLEERVKGVVAVAVPVWEHNNTGAAALSVSIPAVRAGRDELVAMTPTVHEAAATLSSRLGHVPGGESSA